MVGKYLQGPWKALQRRQVLISRASLQTLGNDDRWWLQSFITSNSVIWPNFTCLEPFLDESRPNWTEQFFFFNPAIEIGDSWLHPEVDIRELEGWGRLLVSISPPYRYLNSPWGNYLYPNYLYNSDSTCSICLLQRIGRPSHPPFPLQGQRGVVPVCHWGCLSRRWESGRWNGWPGFSVFNGGILAKVSTGGHLPSRQSRLVPALFQIWFSSL